MNRKQWNWQRRWRKIPAVVAILVIAWACVGVAGPALAEESIQDLKATIEQLKQTVLRLEKKMQVMEKKQAEVQETVSQKADKGTTAGGLKLPKDTTLSIYGYAKMDALYTDVDGGGTYTYVPGAVPLDSQKDALADNKFTMHARQTRLGVMTRTDTDYGPFTTKIETDFFGAGGNERYSNSYGLRLRRAYGELGRFLIGQEWSTFIDLGAYPETIDFGGAAGSLFIRQPMIRYTHPFDGGSFQFALENPESSYASGATTGIGGSGEYIPDIIARVNLKSTVGRFSVVGMVRQLTIDNGVYDDSAWGGAMSLNAVIPTFGKDNFHFEFNFGNALGRYMEAEFDDAFINPATNEIETCTQWGGFISYQHFWMKNLRSTLIYSIAERDNDLEYVADTLDKRYQSVHANLIWSPIPRVNVGLEYIWGYRELENGDDGDINRLQSGFQYKF